MLIMPDVKWIERVSLGHVNSLDGPLSLSLQKKNKILMPYPRPKRSMLLLLVVVHNYFGCNILSRIIVTL
jgi:hypothetical protein